MKSVALAGPAVFIPAGVSHACSSVNHDSFELNRNPLNLGLMTWTLAKDWDIDTIIKNLSETNYQSVELRTTHAHGVEVSLNSRERAEVKKRFEDSPIEEISLASAFTYDFPDPGLLRQNIEGAKEYILLARDVGATGVRVFPDIRHKDVPMEQTLEQIGKAVAEVGEFGYNQGVEVRLEVHGSGTNRVPIIRRIIDYSNSPHVYVLWNSVRNDLEGEGLEYNFNLVKDRIRGVHIHELWDETYPYRELFKLLSDNNFKGYCNAEIAGNEDPVRLLRYYRGLFLALQNAL